MASFRYALTFNIILYNK